MNIKTLDMDENEFIDVLIHEASFWYGERPLLARLLWTAAVRLRAHEEIHEVKQ